MQNNLQLSLKLEELESNVLISGTDSFAPKDEIKKKKSNTPKAPY